MVNFFVVTPGSPLKVCIINRYVSSNIRTGTMCKRIVNITTIDLVIIIAEREKNKC